MEKKGKKKKTEDAQEINQDDVATEQPPDHEGVAFKCGKKEISFRRTANGLKIGLVIQYLGYEFTLTEAQRLELRDACFLD